MDRLKVIESHLLSRCNKHTPETILTTLSQRYSVTGTQKPYLVLESTEGISEPIQIPKNKYDPTKTKSTFRKSIKETINSQNLFINKVRLLENKPNDILQSDQLPKKLRKLSKKIPKFEYFMNLNKLWNVYISELLNDKQSPINSQTVGAKLSSCEFVGAHIQCVFNICPDFVGLEGIIVWDSKEYYLICIPRRTDGKGSLRERVGGMRKIPKKGARFKFKAPIEDSYIEFEIIGDRMNVRSVDRSNKKFKSHNVDDINL
ncbi:RNase P/RNase MRP complex subunit [Martiniozyma asiatica (nom. inval.)]|nr:RNase P/RNase MRP complex subunit [Martiniozyma asiatica]